MSGVSLCGILIESAIQRRLLNPVLDKSCSENIVDRIIGKIAIAIFTLVSFGKFTSYKQRFFDDKSIEAAKNGNVPLLKRYLPAYPQKFYNLLHYAIKGGQPHAVEYLLKEKSLTLKENTIQNLLLTLFQYTLRDNLTAAKSLKILPLLLQKASKTTLATDVDTCFAEITKIWAKDTNFSKESINLLVNNGLRIQNTNWVFAYDDADCENYYNNCLAAITTT